jgi:rRNA-processing protein FCF1
MMFVVDSLRRLCLNRAGKKTERAIAQIAAAWNEQMHIPNVDLIFDSTHQLDQIGSVRVSSAQPTYKTTDDMLIEIARRNENQEKNKHTIVVTSDRALAIHVSFRFVLIIKCYFFFRNLVETRRMFTREILQLVCSLCNGIST